MTLALTMMLDSNRLEEVVRQELGRMVGALVLLLAHTVTRGSELQVLTPIPSIPPSPPSRSPSAWTP